MKSFRISQFYVDNTKSVNLTVLLQREAVVQREGRNTNVFCGNADPFVGSRSAGRIAQCGLNGRIFYAVHFHALAEQVQLFLCQLVLCAKCPNE